MCFFLFYDRVDGWDLSSSSETASSHVGVVHTAWIIAPTSTMCRCFGERGPPSPPWPLVDLFFVSDTNVDNGIREWGEWGQDRTASPREAERAAWSGAGMSRYRVDWSDGLSLYVNPPPQPPCMWPTCIWDFDWGCFLMLLRVGSRSNGEGRSQSWAFVSFDL